MVNTARELVLDRGFIEFSSAWMPLVFHAWRGGVTGAA
jgi:hypothetical protein